MTQPTNLFLPRLRAWSLSAAVGSGKTRAAVAWMSGPATERRNVIYVAPTLMLLNQTHESLRQALVEAKVGRNVHLVTKERSAGRVEAEALASVNDSDAAEGRVMLLTTTTFLSIVSRITKPELWSIVLDEAFEPATFTTFKLGSDVASGWAHFSEAFSIDASQGHRILPAAGMSGRVDEIARGDFRNAGDRFKGMQEVAEGVANPALRCELVMTDVAKALASGELPSRAAVTADSEDKAPVAVLQFSSYVDPSAFVGFREVIFLAALFETTVLYALWTRALGVTFASHPDFPTEMLRDTHKEQGHCLAVGHLLAPGDVASLENLKRDALTGESSTAQAGAPQSVLARSRVIDRLIETATVHFAGEPFLLQSNERFGYAQGSHPWPDGAVWIPAMAQGRNDFKHIDNVAALFIRNPNTQQLAWVRSRTGMGSKEATQAFRIQAIYQALGRCSIRHTEPTTKAKVVLTVGENDATFLHQLFPGSHWMGQVGTMPAMRTLRAGGEAKEMSKTERLAHEVLLTLDSLDPEVTEIGSRELQRQVLAQRHQGSLIDRRSDEDQPSTATWTRGVSQACVLGSGWRRQSQKLVRVTAALYGFEAA